MHPERGIIDIADPNDPQGPSGGIDGIETEGPDETRTIDDGPSPHVAVTAGPFTILLPLPSIHRIAGQRGVPSGHRRAGACPLFDLATLLGRYGADGTGPSS